MESNITQPTESDLMVSIVHTIKTLIRIEGSIKKHQSYNNPDKMAIEQWQEVHADLTKQLVTMLAEAGVNVQVPTKTLEHA
jgi:CheY-specific phosphatase CheX